MRRGGQDNDDMVQAARVGLLQAADRFDPGRGLKFITYASYWINRNLQDEAARTTLIPLKRAGRRMTGLHVLTPDRFLEISVTGASGEDSAPRILTDSRPDPLAHLLRSDAEELLGRLPDRHAMVLRLRHGLGGEDPVTLNAIGLGLGLSRERVRQIELQALTMLRAGRKVDTYQCDGCKDTFRLPVGRTVTRCPACRRAPVSAEPVQLPDREAAELRQCSRAGIARAAPQLRVRGQASVPVARVARRRGRPMNPTLQVACDSCGAEPQRHCRSSTGKDTQIQHASRRRKQRGEPEVRRAQRAAPPAKTLKPIAPALQDALAGISYVPFYRTPAGERLKLLLPEIQAERDRLANFVTAIQKLLRSAA